MSTPPPILPHPPPRAFADLAAAGGHIGDALDDFSVDELPLYAPSGEGAHVYVRMKKRGLTTHELLRAVARASGAHERDLGSAGMKDKHAVTTQWISVPERSTPPDQWKLPDSIELVEVSRHGNKLRTGHQRGNRFRIRLVGVPPDGVERARAIVARIAAEGLPNYFGVQRFGRGGGNVAEALAWLRARPSEASERSEWRGRRDGGPASRGRFAAKFMPSVIQSEVFNRYLTARGENAARLLDGEVVRLAKSNVCFVVEDVAKELPRLDASDVFATGPIIGPEMLAARGEVAALEARIVAELGLTGDDLTALGRSAPGTRRDLVVHPEALSIEATAERELVLTFELPSGSYATELVRQITG